MAYFDQQLNLHLGLDAQPDIQILKVITILYTSLTGISNEFLNCGGEFMTLASKPKAKRTTFCLSSHLTIKENTNYFCAFKKYLCSQRTCTTVATKEVVLRGGPPSVDGGQSNRKVNQINSENHQLIVKKIGGPTSEKLRFKRWQTSENPQVTF